MKARANARVTILRGTAPDDYGDNRNLPKPVATGVTASIIEQTKTAQNPADGMVRRVRIQTGRVPAGTDVRDGDQIRDEATNSVYIVDAVTTPTNSVRGMDIRLDLRRVT